MLEDLNDRSREIFRQIVEAYLETGEPIGSQKLSQRLKTRLSSASIRNVMAEMEAAGLLFSPHTSSGRLPTDAGLRFFVDGLLELGNLSSEERAAIEAHCAATGRSMFEVLRDASDMLSGLSSCVGLVVAPKKDARIRHIEFVELSPGRALVILVSEGGAVENRIIEIPTGMPKGTLKAASNYLVARMLGHTFAEVRGRIQAEIDERRAEFDELTSRVVEAGLATWSGGEGPQTLIVRGQSKLLEDVSAVEDLEKIRNLFSVLEEEADVLELLNLAETAEGVRIYIGSENQLFDMSGCAMVVAPYASEKIVGAIGIIGPTRLNYARIIPMVDYTAKVVSRMVG